MKKIKGLTATLLVLLMFTTLTGCSPVKGDLKDYINDKLIKVFLPADNEITKIHTDIAASEDETTILNGLSTTIPEKIDALLTKMKAFKAETTEVQELHNMYIKVIEIRKEGYALMLEAFTTKASDPAASDIAVAKLAEASTKYKEFEKKA